MSDQMSLISTSFTGPGSFSPDSVLHSPKLHKIISGKEVTEEDLQDNGSRVQEHGKKGVARKISRTRKRVREDNKDSRLVEIIPGLQRLGKKVDGDEEIKEGGDDDRAEVSRLYLSEAWEAAETRRGRKENPLMNWRVPDVDNEIDMKDSLRWWAHTVASTVR
ncbi:hypothetical protein F3Y22_tig00117002pilonHSYRG00091 [Hibiscus syriacus]|uniref:Uncharacterized protein n=1 Tax=Hibiscus syriacus TaxID=106335 RepID=A0A6A2WDH3_HIBSY|nr:hypothetical protein F3Y22_tig00117002pilonHSYRG00091 [Hibiscus syriacus]